MNVFGELDSVVRGDVGNLSLLGGGWGTFECDASDEVVG